MFKGLCVVGGGQVDLKWENSIIKYAKLLATCDFTYYIKLPAYSQNTIILKNGKIFNTFVDDKNILTIALTKGDVLEMNFKK